MILSPGFDKEAREWCAAKGYTFTPPFVSFIAVQDGEIKGVAIFNNYEESNIELSIIVDTPKACNRPILRAIFSYPFEQLGLNRVTVRTRAKSKATRKLIRRLGFTPEGRSRRFFKDNDDAMIYGMVREQCRWL